MRQCSNPTYTHQVEDDARFCGMCGAYVGPEMTSHATLIDASTQRIQQCRDLINSLQSEPDEKEKAQKIRAVMNILISINTSQLPGKPLANVAEQLQVLSTVVQEMIRLLSISPTASAADIQHWPISPLEMQQWTELLIALTGSNKFSSLDEATKSAVKVALGRFISFVSINARSNPDADHVLLDLYESMTALSVPELLGCFLGVDKNKLFGGLEQRMQNALAGSPPSVSPQEIRAYGALATATLPGLSQTEREARMGNILDTLGKVEEIVNAQSDIAVATMDAFAALLQAKVENTIFTSPKALVRMKAIRGLNFTAYTSAVVHHQHVSPDVLNTLSRTLPELIGHGHQESGSLIFAARQYIQLLGAIAYDEPERTEEIAMKLGELSMRSRAQLNRLDRSLVQEADNLPF